MNGRGAGHAVGFTLVELLVVIAVIGLVLGIVLPGLASSREAGRGVVCASNIRQLGLALDLYATDAEDRYAPGAANILANLDRWHGRRASASLAFEPGRGPLTPYFDGGSDGVGRSIRACPTFGRALSTLAEAGAGFERGCGGYAYNAAFVGCDRSGERFVPGTGGSGAKGQARGVSSVRSDVVGSSRARFGNPGGTLGFADGALAVESPAGDVIEYSFVEPRFHPHLATAARPDPSIHFRHGAVGGGRGWGNGAGRASVAWLDGHVSAEGMTHSESSGLYGPTASVVGIGWFGGDDNAVFDYR